MGEEGGLPGLFLFSVPAVECGASSKEIRHRTKFLYAMEFARQDEFYTQFLSVAPLVISSV